MRVRVSRKNVSDREMAKAISGLIVGEGIERDVMERLEKADTHKHTEPIPERYVRGIDERMQRAYGVIMGALYLNMDRWFEYQAKKPMRKTLLRKADDKDKSVVSQRQIDELRMLIESHFRHALGIELGIPKDILRAWKAAGVEMPDEDLNKWIRQSYVAGRLSEILKNNSTYEQMLKAAKKLHLSRVDQLALEAAEQNAATFVKGYALRSATLAENLMIQHNKNLINGIMQGYISGELKQTHRNDEGLTPEEVNSIQTDKAVNGWEELATELKNRFKNQDAGRDWDRIARTEIRFANNLGRLTNIQIEGGGDADEIEVYFHVQPEACRYCKELYLNPDGTPKVFKLSYILQNVRRTGGMQGNLKASRIGEEDGWVPNATCHPNGHCYPVRVISGYRTPMMNDKGGE